jgi:Icc protein
MITVAQISDTHLFADDSMQWKGVNPGSTLTQVIKRLKLLEPTPDSIILTGDMSQDETPESYQGLYSKFQGLEIPIYWLPGNHDRPNLMTEILANKPFSTDKTIKMGQWRFILLNSAVTGQPQGYLTVDTMAQLELDLTQNPEATIIAVHHHPVKIGSLVMDGMKLENGAELVELVQRFPQVKAVIFGHIHAVFDEWIGDVRYLGCPSSCLQLRHDQPELVIDDLPPGFRLLYLDDDGSLETKLERIS